MQPHSTKQPLKGIHWGFKSKQKMAKKTHQLSGFSTFENFYYFFVCKLDTQDVPV